MRTTSPIVYGSVAALLLACSDSTGPNPTPPGPPGQREGGFQVAPATATLQSGQTQRFTTTLGWKRSAAGAVAWASSDESVAVVRNGLVRGVSGGQARIVATWGGHQASATVNVISPWRKHEAPPVCLNRSPRTERLPMSRC